MMEMQNPFTWGQGGQKLSPAQVAQQRQIAAALAARNSAPKDVGEGLSRVGDALLYRANMDRASKAEDEGRAVREALMAKLTAGDPSQADLIGAMGNDWVQADPGSSAVVQTLLGQEMKRNDPGYQMDLEKSRLELDALRNPKPPKPEFGFEFAPDGTLLRTDATSGTLEEMGSFAKPDGGLTDTQRNLAWRAEQAGLSPGTPEYAEFMRSGGQSTGMALSVGPDGTVSFAQGAGAGGKPLTENQSKLTLFQSLQTETQPVLLDLETQFNPGNLADAAARSTPIAGNFFQSERGQIYNSAATAWAEGALRIATGAAATPEEMERTKRAYFAQPGDTPNTIMFKAQMREMYNRAIQRSLGQKTEGGLPKPSEFAEQLSSDGLMSGQDGAPKQISSDADYDALPSGAVFIAPDGSTRKKP